MGDTRILSKVSIHLHPPNMPAQFNSNRLLRASGIKKPVHFSSSISQLTVLCTERSLSLQHRSTCTLAEPGKEAGLRISFIVMYCHVSDQFDPKGLEQALRNAYLNGKTMELTLQTHATDSSNMVYRILKGNMTIICRPMPELWAISAIPYYSGLSMR